MIQEKGFDLDIVGMVLYLCTILAAKYAVGPVSGASFAEYGRFRSKYDVVLRNYALELSEQSQRCCRIWQFLNPHPTQPQFIKLLNIVYFLRR
jgi:hypothetical protein